MPASGPNQDYAYQQGEKATEEILALLKDKYGATRPHEALPLGKKFAAEWDELEKKLRETVKEMVWTDHAASW